MNIETSINEKFDLDSEKLRDECGILGVYLTKPETDDEAAMLSYLQEEEWNYLAGSQVSRTFYRDVLIVDDMKSFLSKTNPDLLPDEVQ